MTVLITGGAGLIGSHIADMVAGRGDTPVIFDNLEPVTHGGRWPEWVKWPLRVRGDVRNRGELSRLEPHTIFHQAAYGGFDPDAAEKMLLVNALGTLNVLDLARETGAQVVLASSQAVYGDPGSSDPVSEDAPLRPTTSYGLSKLYAEQAALLYGEEHGVTVKALRYALTYGPRQSVTNPYTGIASIFSNRILQGQPPVVFEDGGQLRDFTFVEDVARANLLVADLDAAAGRVFNVGTGVGTSVLEFARALARAYGSDVEPHVTGEKRPGDARDMVTDSTRLRQLGWGPVVPLEEGVRRYAEWFKGRA